MAFFVSYLRVHSCTEKHIGFVYTIKVTNQQCVTWMVEFKYKISSYYSVCFKYKVLSCSHTVQSNHLFLRAHVCTTARPALRHHEGTASPWELVIPFKKWTSPCQDIWSQRTHIYRMHIETKGLRLNRCNVGGIWDCEKAVQLAFDGDMYCL